LLQTPHTLNYRQAARHPNHLRSPFCTKTRSNTAHQQVHNKSYKARVGFNVNGRTYIAVSCRTDGAHVCQAAYTISKDVRHSLPYARREVGSAPPPPRQPVSLILSRHGRTDVMTMKDALRGWSGGGPMHAQCLTVDTCARAGWPRHSASPPTPTAAAVISEQR